MCSGSAEPSIRLAHVLASQLLKFCDRDICCNAPTLNNSQNLNMDFFCSEFLSSMNSGTWECRQMPNFKGNEDLSKLGKEYLNDLLCKFGAFCLQHSKTFDISHAFLRVTIAGYQRSNSRYVFAQLKSKVEVDSGSAKSLHFLT